jgi:hypothetical protein
MDSVEGSVGWKGGRIELLLAPFIRFVVERSASVVAAAAGGSSNGGSSCSSSSAGSFGSSGAA